MSELRSISPLMDGMSVEKELPEHNGRASYVLRRKGGGDRFILKRISVPASDSLVRALILSGAFADEAAIHEYYGGVVESIKAELEAGKSLAASGCFAAALSYQVEAKESGVGYDLYILYPLYVPLNTLLAENLITKLRAINLGIDLCDAVSACRDAGYLFENIKPENIYLMHNGKFLLGDLGLTPLEDLKYASVPEEYIGPYSAPELSDITASPNLTVDLYSLGMVLYRVYNANHGPFEDENTGEAMADKLRLTGKPLPTPLFADYELASIILKACSFREEDRYQSPGELKQALVTYMQRNQISDDLIVPPLVASSEPLAASFEDEAVEDEPIRMSSAEDLDENFRMSFAPDTSGAGSAADIDMTLVMPEEKKAEPEAKKAEPEQKAAAPKQEPAAVSVPAGEVPHASQEEAMDAASSEDGDPDQIDIDELLADISDVIGDEETETAEDSSPEEAEEIPEEAVYLDPEEEFFEEPEESGRPKGNLPRILLSLFLILAAVVVICFLVAWYFVEAKELNLVSVSTDRLVMQLVTDEGQENFSLTCSDSHGNSYPVTVEGDIYTFTGLSELTTYTITVEAQGSHRLTNSSVLGSKVTTPENTDIVEFTATRGEADGEVLLSFTHEGPTPEQWQLSYTNADGSHTDTFLFEENTYLVGGLKLNDTYTFTLENTESCFLAGNTSLSYEMIPIVEAKNLNISQISGKEVTVSWEPGENLPGEWLVTCEAEGMEPITQTVTGTSCVLELPDLARDYTVSIDARGMDITESLTLPADPIVVENLKATHNEDGTVTLTWDTPAGTPEGGWYISYNTVGSLHAPYMLSAEPVKETSVTLEYLIPEAKYEFSLNVSAADAAKQVFGETTVAVETGKVQAFDGYSLSPKAPINTSLGYISLWREPNKTNWKYTDLSDKRSTFGVDSRIAICLQVNSVAASGDEVHVAYVIRNSDGQVVNDIYSVKVWNDLWYSRRHASAIPLPAAEGESSVPGSYTVEIYINGKLLASAGFTIQ